MRHVYELPSIPKVVQELIENFNSKSADHVNEQINSGTDTQTIMSGLPEELTASLALNTYKLFEQLQNFTNSVDDIDELLAA